MSAGWSDEDPDEVGIDYQLVLHIINSSDNPAGALKEFVAQEREAANERVKSTCDGFENLAGYPVDVVDADDYLRGATDVARAIRRQAGK